MDSGSSDNEYSSGLDELISDQELNDNKVNENNYAEMSPCCYDSDEVVESGGLGSDPEGDEGNSGSDSSSFSESQLCVDQDPGLCGETGGNTGDKKSRLDPSAEQTDPRQVSAVSTDPVSTASGSDVSVSFHRIPANVLPVGGSGASETSHITKHTSGNQALELVEAIMNRGHEASFDTVIETRGSVESDVKEVHVHLTQTNIHNPTAVTVGGQVVVKPKKERKTKQGIPETPHPPTQLQRQRCETETKFEKWTEGMVLTKGVQAVLDKIAQGRSLITISGCPGEGKTTTGYLVLKKLHSMGRQVYDIVTPDDYFRAKEAKQAVLMINDMFGSLHYDHDKRWRDVLNDILAMIEHKREDELESRERRKPSRLIVLLICRSSILREASCHLGRLKDLILNKDLVVDLTHGIGSTVEERMKIWQYHSDKYQITIDEKIVKDVCQKSSQHGFPHCCRLFASMYAKNKLTNMETFFSKPLEFLNQTMEAMMADGVKGPLLREMLKHDGKLYLDNIIDDEKRFQFSTAVDTLLGTYLSQDCDTVTFHHPSVYDSAAFIVCLKDPLFVVRNCSLSFLKDRVKFLGVKCGSSVGSQQMVTVDNRYVSNYLDRLETELGNGCISLTLSQDSFHDETFALQFMQRILPIDKSKSGDKDKCSDQIRNLINKKDRTSNETFLFLSTKSKSDNILKYISDFIEFTQDELTEALFGICEHTSVKSLLLISKKYYLNMNIKNMESQTPLLLSATKGSEEMIQLILQKDTGIEEVDKTATLHCIMFADMEQMEMAVL